MNVSSISITVATQGNVSSSPASQFKASLQSLKDALSSGNLSDAKAAFENFEKSLPSTESGESNVAVFASVSKALDAGDIGAALDALQKALEALLTKDKKSDKAPDMLDQLLEILKEVLDKMDATNSGDSAKDSAMVAQTLAQKLGLSSSGTYSSAGTTSISIGLNIKA